VEVLCGVAIEHEEDGYFEEAGIDGFEEIFLVLEGLRLGLEGDRGWEREECHTP
jgi:hypothetical protein